MLSSFNLHAGLCIVANFSIFMFMAKCLSVYHVFYYYYSYSHYHSSRRSNIYPTQRLKLIATMN